MSELNNNSEKTWFQKFVDFVIGIIKTLGKIVIVFIFSLVVFITGIIIYFNARTQGANIGNQIGTRAGKLLGTFEAINKHLKNEDEDKEEIEQVIDDALSADDTEAQIKSTLHAIGKLEVLEANVVLHDVMEVGDEYRALFAFYGTVTYTVDLNNAEFNFDNENIIVVTLPEPEREIMIDNKKSEQLDVLMDYEWSGTQENGYKAFMNSVGKIESQSEEVLKKYDSLLDTSKESAKSNVKFLIESVTPEGVTANVYFKNSREPKEQ